MESSRDVLIILPFESIKDFPSNKEIYSLSILVIKNV